MRNVEGGSRLRTKLNLKLLFRRQCTLQFIFGSIRTMRKLLLLEVIRLKDDELFQQSRNHVKVLKELMH